MRGARRTPRSGGPSCNDPGATGWRHRILGDSAVTPCQAARRCQGPQRRVTNSAHRGSCGASLKTPRAGRRMKDGLAVLDNRRAAVFSGTAAPLRRREMPEPGGPLGPRRPARPRTFPSGRNRPDNSGEKRAAGAADALRCHGVDAQIHYSNTQWSAVMTREQLQQIAAAKNSGRARRKWANWPVAPLIGLSYHFGTFQR